MTLHASDLFLILLLLTAGFAVGCLLVLRRTRHIVNDSQLKIADRLGQLDEAIQVLETRLAEHHSAETREVREGASEAYIDQEASVEAGEPVTSEIKAAIAAAATAVIGGNAQVKSIKPVSSPWSQQGRALVQGSHNLRARR